MAKSETISRASLGEREQTREYLFDMIGELAKMARQAGERSVAIHLEAIIAARRVAAEDRLFQ